MDERPSRMNRRNVEHIQTVWWQSAPDETTGRDANGRDADAAKRNQPTLYEELVEFVSNITLHCFRWLLEPTISGWENLMWCVVHLISVVSLALMVNQAYMQYVESPMVTTLYDTLYPVGSVPFPAIAICSNNRMSRSMAMAYAAELETVFTNTTLSSGTLLDNIRQMGHLYDSDLDADQELTNFIKILDESDDTPNAYDVAYHMDRMAPKCEDILMRCIWRGQERPCMEQHLMFESRYTQYGLCCTFNYVRPDSLAEEELKSYFIDDTGPELGLILLLNGSSSDYFYPYYNFVGFIVQVFNPSEYPDVPSGGVSERHIKLGYETLIRVDSSSLVAEDEIRRYSPESRGCLFNDEMKKEFGDRYKRSDCVINCRAASIAALCNCLLFFMPKDMLGDNGGAANEYPICSLQHLPCLNRYRIKWATMVMQYEKTEGLEVEMEDGLFCAECLPSCSDTTYVPSHQSLPLIPTERPYPNILIGDMLNDIFALHYVVQFSFSSLIICVTCFQLSAESPFEQLSQFMFHCEYFVCMSFEIFLPCYYGSCVSAQSAQLFLQMYSANWIEQSARFKSAMRIFVIRAQRPIALFTYKEWFAIELPTFVSILRFAYSMLSCLKAN